MASVAAKAELTVNSTVEPTIATAVTVLLADVANAVVAGTEAAKASDIWTIIFVASAALTVALTNVGAVTSDADTLLVMACAATFARLLPITSCRSLVPGAVYARVRAASPFTKAVLTVTFRCVESTNAMAVTVCPADTAKEPNTGAAVWSIASLNVRFITVGVASATDAAVMVGAVTSDAAMLLVTLASRNVAVWLPVASCNGLLTGLV